MLRRIAFALFAIFVVATGQTAQAQRAGELLYIWAEADIDPSKRVATIDVSDAPGAVRGLRVRTPDGALLLSNVRVIYSEGPAFEERRRINLLRGERTRPINPTSGDRFVEQILLTIDPETTPARSVRVQILAHQTRRGRRSRRPEPNATPGATAADQTVDTREETREVAAVQSSGSVLDTDREPEAEPDSSPMVLFGAQRVALALDRDVISVPPTIARFRRIRLRALENPLSLTGLTIVYADGGREAIDVEAELSETDFSDWIDVNPAHFIEEIRLAYRSREDFRGRARIEVFGSFADGWLGATGDARRFNDGWVLLGAQTAGFVGFDDDSVAVGRNDGGFRQVRVRVRDRSITLNELSIMYGDGTSDTVPVRTRVDAGSTWGPIDLADTGRAIREVRARYRSRFFDRAAAGRGAAIVEVWGRY